MKLGVLVFPGSNCDHDCYYALKHVLKLDVDFVWHKEKDLSQYDVIVLPGGFSYGDYLRTGAIARFSPVMEGVIEFANKREGLVIGICNGFQILCEAGLLPGALMRNRSIRFVCEWTHLRVENDATAFSNQCQEGDVLHMPVAHGEGLFYADSETLRQLNENKQVVFRYCNERGEASDAANPNGSLENIAGIINRDGNVLGMMPHPDRSAEQVLGSADGLKVFESMVHAAEQVIVL